MGFPKPWPTDWPGPEVDPPEPNEIDDENDEDIEELPAPKPEYFRAFYSVTWAVNHACNLRCTHCYDVVPFARSDLNTDQALRLIGHIREAGVHFIAFSGGEPFLRRDLLHLMEICREHEIGFSVRANGTRITPEVAERLKALGMSVAGISFDGATEQTHDAVRGSGAFRAALEGLRNLLDRGIRAQMEVVLSRQNAHEALAFIELGEAVGASEVNFSALTPVGRGAQRVEDLLDHQLWERLTQILAAARRNASFPVTPNCALLGPCVANIEPHITCDGWMSPCYLSQTKLFEVLKTPPDAMSKWLAATRNAYQDCCGRRAWTAKGI